MRGLRKHVSREAGNTTRVADPHQFEGRLKELYLLYIDPKLRRRDFPETWTEVSQEATDI